MVELVRLPMIRVHVFLENKCKALIDLENMVSVASAFLLYEWRRIFCFVRLLFPAKKGI